MTSRARQAGLCVLGAGLFALVVFALARPQGVPQMMDRYREVKRLEEEVKQLREQVYRKQHEVEQLKVSEEARKRAIRQHLNKALPGETTIILPPEPLPGADAAAPQ